ncbi:H(+)-transporting V1 sector ATPase subunit G [Scheffersomyces spartinae]|uniref:V-type proton ATPase subunit G n=1 Tax=Scheffersomyces spartinae TaxID=45513 RepID=A0A9P8AHJ2_9ASCO|nr:H(+)-transporting V1 sector ATPase subunit G [Scheffersomyces spartinae]KAG7192748.1 H(+)-transporting V1 sector ATPase subunit G [Scheffersomyces spartinae]
MSSGIQSLLKAEKEAAELINEARKYRTERLKAAKVDAQSEIDDYKKLKENELLKYEQEHAGLNETIEKEADTEVESELVTIKKNYESKQKQVISLLVDAVTKPSPELHINA